jgi:hypothetical protein
MPRKLTTDEFIESFGKCFCSKVAIAILEQKHLPNLSINSSVVNFLGILESYIFKVRGRVLNFNIST